MASTNDSSFKFNKGETSDEFNLPSTSAHHANFTSRLLSTSIQWFHGKMGKTEAETLLRDSAVGSFLVRLQSNNRYFISVLSEEGLVEHLPINQLSHNFYFMGVRYESLFDIVEIFSENPALAPLPSLQTPQSRTASTSTSWMSTTDDLDRELFYCSQSFFGQEHNEQLSLDSGDLVSVFDQVDADWSIGRNERNGRNGLVPTKNLEPLLSSTSAVSQLPYYLGAAETSDDARIRMADAGPGSFCVRSSSKGPEYSTLLVYTGPGRIEKYLIRRDGQGTGYILAGRRFPTIQHVVRRYALQPIGHGVRLNHAVLCSQGDDVIDHADAKLGHAPFDCQQTAGDGVSSFSDLTASDYCNHNATVSTIASAKAQRKSREDKDWKDCWLSMTETDGRAVLVVSDTKTTSPHCLLDLCSSCLYPLDESVFNREGCLFFSQNNIDFPGIFLCLRPAILFLQWIHTLRLRIGHAPMSSSFSNSHSETPIGSIGMLQLFVDKFRSDSLKTATVYSAYCAVNGVKVCSTQRQVSSPRRGSVPSIVFDAGFLIPFLPQKTCSIQLSLIQHANGAKKGRAFGLSPLLGLPHSTPIEHSLDNGFSFRAHNYRIPVLSADSYAPLREWLSACPVSSLDSISDALSLQQRSLFCYALVATYLAEPRRLFALLRSLVGSAMSRCSSNNVLRQDSLATSLLTQTLRVVARSQLEDALVEAGCTAIRSVPNDSDVATVVSCLTRVVSSNRLVSEVLSLVAGLAKEKFPDVPNIQHCVISGVFILRFANPVIFGTMNGHAMTNPLVKAVQSAANHAASPSRHAAEIAAVVALRQTFERIADTKLSEAPPPELGQVSCDWLPICCHLMQLAISSNRTNFENLPPQLLRLLARFECTPMEK